jgi:hypothetical protein
MRARTRRDTSFFDCLIAYLITKNVPDVFYISNVSTMFISKSILQRLDISRM